MRAEQCGEVSAETTIPKETRARAHMRACLWQMRKRTRTHARIQARGQALICAYKPMRIGLGTARADGGAHFCNIGRARQPIAHVGQRAEGVR